MIVEILLLLLVVVIWRHWYNSPQGLPPGPPTFPLVGTLKMPLTLPSAREYRKKYGDIFKCEMGPFKLIYICDFKLVKEALSKMEVADRPNLEGFHFLSDGKEAGIIFSNGSRWQNARRFLLRNLRDLGMGKSYLDEVIIHEARFLVQEFKSVAGKPTRFPFALNLAILNIVWQLVASRRYDLDNKDVTNFMRLLRVFQEESVGFFMLEMFPVFKKILPKFILDRLFRLEGPNKAVAAAKKLFKDVIETRKAEFDRTNPKNVIDEYLIQMEQKTETSEYFDEMDLTRTSFDLFAAGFDTTSNMLRWMCLYAAKYPEIQVRVQRQIDEVLNRDEFPGNQHKPQLPLVEAFIHEVLRHSSMIPLGVMRATNDDVQLGGYNIPKGCIVFAGFGLCHEDPKYWEDPQEFRLERFLDKEGRFITHREGFAPFGIGKRVCLGEAFARMELSIFTAALLQNFTFSPPEGKEVDLTPADIPMNQVVKDQEIVFTVRK